MADVLSILIAERDRLDRAIAVLDGTAPRRGRRPGGASSGTDATSVAGAAKNGRRKKGKRTMSPEARARMSAMMKKRWAERRKAAKKASKEAGA